MFIELFSEFKQRMGCECIQIEGDALREGGQRWLFSNGAQSDGNTHFDPPTDPLALLQMRRKFVLAKLDFIELDFVNLKRYVENQALIYKLRAGHRPEPEAIADLKRLAKQVRMLNTVLELIEDQILELSPSRQHWAEVEEDRRQRAAEMEALRAEVRAITI